MMGGTAAYAHAPHSSHARCVSRCFPWFFCPRSFVHEKLGFFALQLARTAAHPQSEAAIHRASACASGTAAGDSPHNVCGCVCCCFVVCCFVVCRAAFTHQTRQLQCASRHVHQRARLLVLPAVGAAVEVSLAVDQGGAELLRR